MLDHLRRTVIQVGEGMLSVVGLRFGTEEPDYRAETLADDVEIRHYGSRIAAETTAEGEEEAARSAGFRRLAGYIFGGNRRSVAISMTAPVAQQSRANGQKIAMTAPVAQSSGPNNSWLIRFYMPAKWTMDSLPVPNDSAVKLVTVPAETVAVLRFSGDRGSEAVASHAEQLQATLNKYGFDPSGPPTAWFYDPPWTLPFRRRNEIAIPVRTR